MEHAIVIAYGPQPRTVLFKDSRSTRELIEELRETGFIEVVAPYTLGNTRVEKGSLFFGKAYIISVV